MSNKNRDRRLKNHPYRKPILPNERRTIIPSDYRIGDEFYQLESKKGQVTYTKYYVSDILKILEDGSQVAYIAPF